MRALKFQQLGNTHKIAQLTGRPTGAEGKTLVITDHMRVIGILNFFCCAVNIRADKYVKAGYNEESHFVTCCIIYSDRRIRRKECCTSTCHSLANRQLEFTEMKTGLDTNYFLCFTESDARVLNKKRWK